MRLGERVEGSLVAPDRQGRVVLAHRFGEHREADDAVGGKELSADRSRSPEQLPCRRHAPWRDAGSQNEIGGVRLDRSDGLPWRLHRDTVAYGGRIDRDCESCALGAHRAGVPTVGTGDDVDLSVRAIRERAGRGRARPEGIRTRMCSRRTLSVLERRLAGVRGRSPGRTDLPVHDLAGPCCARGDVLPVVATAPPVPPCSTPTWDRHQLPRTAS